MSLHFKVPRDAPPAFLFHGLKLPDEDQPAIYSTVDLVVTNHQYSELTPSRVIRRVKRLDCAISNGNELRSPDYVATACVQKPTSHVSIDRIF
jgi:hypothetical protein